MIRTKVMDKSQIALNLSSGYISQSILLSLWVILFFKVLLLFFFEDENRFILGTTESSRISAWIDPLPSKLLVFYLLIPAAPESFESLSSSLLVLAVDAEYFLDPRGETDPVLLVGDMSANGLFARLWRFLVGVSGLTNLPDPNRFWWVDPLFLSSIWIFSMIFYSLTLSTSSLLAWWPSIGNIKPDYGCSTKLILLLLNYGRILPLLGPAGFGLKVVSLFFYLEFGLWFWFDMIIFLFISNNLQ